MIEDKKLLYISRRQRIAVFVSLLICVIAVLFLMYFAATTAAYSGLLEPGGQVLQLLLLGSGGWGLIVLYASANSAERISKETDRFFSADVLAAFSRQGFKEATDRCGREARLIRNQSGSALYKISLTPEVYCYLWCHLNVNELSVVHLLDSVLAPYYEQAFQATLKGFAAEGVSLQSFGVQTHDADGALSSPASFLELYVRRKLPNDFLFDAASRYGTANCLVGDARSIVVEMSRARNAPLASSVS